MPQNILTKLLTKNRSSAQVVGAAVGAFIGLTLLLFSLQTWFDLHKILRGASEGDNYVILNKPVSLANETQIKKLEVKLQKIILRRR